LLHASENVQRVATRPRHLSVCLSDCLSQPVDRSQFVVKHSY